MILDLVPGGDLMDLVMRRHCYGEHEARRFFKRLLEGLAYCHERWAAAGWRFVVWTDGWRCACCVGCCWVALCCWVVLRCVAVCLLCGLLCLRECDLYGGASCHACMCTALSSDGCLS